MIIMSGKLEDNIKIVKEYFKDFTNFIELEDFRSFLLLTLSSQVPMSIMAQLGLGGNKEIINLPYDPNSKMYFQKANLMTSGSLIIYTRSEAVTKEFFIEKDDEIIRKTLTSNEYENALRGIKKFVFPNISDCSTTDDDNLIVKIDDLFHSMESFISYTSPHIIFVLDAKDSSSPDVLFTFNMMPQFPKKLDESILNIDVYLDFEHKTKDIAYIKREEDYKLLYLKDVKELGHAEAYKSSFTVVLHIKSLNSPY
jgi:hypothetical protein